MASKGLRAYTYQGTTNIEADYYSSHTTEILIGYTACYVALIYFQDLF
jgi:hypothetical protein